MLNHQATERLSRRNRKLGETIVPQSNRKPMASEMQKFRDMNHLLDPLQLSAHDLLVVRVREGSGGR